MPSRRALDTNEPTLLTVNIADIYTGFFGDTSVIARTDIGFNAFQNPNDGSLLPGGIGTVYGLAWHKSSKQLFASAMTKVDSIYGPAGTGGIYLVDPSVPTATLFLNFETYFGTYVAGVYATTGNAGTGLDRPAAADVTKTALGDIDLSEDGTTLYTINLATRQLYEVPVGSLPVAPASASSIGVFALPTPSNCPATDVRPFGLGINGDKVYVGSVCSAETSGLRADLRAYVYEFDPATDGFTSKLDFSLDYTRVGIQDWRAWSNVASTNQREPILTDIEFDDGDMVLGFRSRTGDLVQVAAQTHGGEILRACATGAATWAIEGGGTCGGVSQFIPATSAWTGAAPDSSGPLNLSNTSGEWYWDDDGAEYEATMGGLAMIHGSKDILTTQMDGLGSEYKAGILAFNNQTGAVSGGANLQSGAGLASTNARYGKANWAGDIELLCDPAPIEIGNRVWNDLNGDGVQDPGEPGLNSVTVSLQGPTNTVTTVTSGDGNYDFNVNHTTAYTLTVTPPSGYSVTAANAAALNGAGVSSNHAISDTRDSDAVLVGGLATIYYTTGSAGQNNHGLDFGFTQPASGRVDIVNIYTALPASYALSKELLTPDPVRVGEDITFTVRITNTGSTAITVLPLRDLYDVAHLFYLRANVAPDDAINDGQLDWSDLTGSFGQDLAPNQSFAVNTVFVARHDTTFLAGGATNNVARVLITPTQTVTTPVRIQAPTAVELASRQVVYDLNQGVTLSWSTASEAELVGFHLLRREPGKGDWVQLTAEMIPAQQPGQATGASYSFIDSTVQFEHNYLYLVEMVDASGNTSRRELGVVVAGSRVLLPLVAR